MINVYMARVKIYTTPTCAYCKQAKEYFKSKNIEYEEYNVATDEAKRDEMIQKTGQLGVPVIEIDGKILPPGFNRARVSELLEGEGLKAAA